MFHTKILTGIPKQSRKIAYRNGSLSFVQTRTRYSSLVHTYGQRYANNANTTNFSTSNRIKTTFQQRFQSNLKNGEKAVKDQAVKNEANATAEQTTFLQRWMAHKEIPPRWTLKWYGEMTLICTVFAITGTSTMVLVRPAMSEVLGLKGSLKEGPWSYRLCSIVIMTPLYATLLVAVGTVFGRHAYFRHFAVKVSKIFFLFSLYKKMRFMYTSCF